MYLIDGHCLVTSGGVLSQVRIKSVDVAYEDWQVCCDGEHKQQTRGDVLSNQLRSLSNILHSSRQKGVGIGD